MTAAVLALASWLSASPAIAQARTSDQFAACVDLAARAAGGQWLRIVPSDQPCGIGETRMSIGVLRDELYAIEPAAAGRVARPGAKQTSELVIEDTAAVATGGQLLIAASVLAQNDRARFAADPSNSSGAPTEHVSFRCVTLVDAAPAAAPINTSLTIAVPPDSQTGTRRLHGPPAAPGLSTLADALGSTIVDQYAIAAGRHRFAVTCTTGAAVRVRGRASLIVLQY